MNTLKVQQRTGETMAEGFNVCMLLKRADSYFNCLLIIYDFPFILAVQLRTSVTPHVSISDIPFIITIVPCTSVSVVLTMNQSQGAVSTIAGPSTSRTSATVDIYGCCYLVFFICNGRHVADKDLFPGFSQFPRRQRCRCCVSY